ncbi:ataxin-10-like [Antedon mediterranea]|uniref:ataxin-10-like n=1 Tax=Antedon mediterranea TaxID=105859 RepID=UPI003AF934EC
MEKISHKTKHELLETLKNMTDNFKELKNRELLDPQHFVFLAKCLDKQYENIVTVNEGSNKELEKSHHDIIVECLRCLRNACVECQRNQNMLCNSECVKNIEKLIVMLTSHPEIKNQETALRCAVQVLSNAGSGNIATQKIIWDAIFPETLLTLLKFPDSKVQNYTCMLIYHSITSDVNTLQILQPPGIPLVELILELSTKETEQDWCLQILEELLKSPDLFLQCYGNLNDNSKVTLLDITSALLSNDTDNALPSQPFAKEAMNDHQMEETKFDTKIPQLSIDFLAETFEMTLLTGFSADSSTESKQEIYMQIPLLLKVLCLATSNLHVYRPLQNRTSLLVHAVGLLQSSHLVMSETEKTTSSHLIQTDIHPKHGFKRDLIRLVGNMCFRHKDNQNKIRDLNGISLLLDNCSIDPHNPFISQWATLAIRNVCENNLENQRFIEEMKVQGVASNSMLQDMGIETELRDGQVYVKTKSK